MQILNIYVIIEGQLRANTILSLIYDLEEGAIKYMENVFKSRKNFESYLYEVIKKAGQIGVNSLINSLSEKELKLDNEKKLQVARLYGKTGSKKFGNLIVGILKDSDKYTCVDSSSENKGLWVFKTSEVDVIATSPEDPCEKKKTYSNMEIEDELPDEEVFDEGSSGKEELNLGDKFDNELYELIASNMVSITDFCISKYVITQNIYEKVMGNNPSYFKEQKVDNNSWDGLPVETVSFNDAIKFCNKLSIMCGREECYDEKGFFDNSKNGFRLPTIKEWNFVANGGDEKPIHRYAGADNHNAVAWYNINSNGKTHKVTEQKLGVRIESGEVFDMSGNVWEWCWLSNDSKEVICYGGSYEDSESVLELGRDLNKASYLDKNYRKPSIGFRICVNSLN